MTIVRKPSDCSPRQFHAFKKLVLAGGEVDEARLETRIKSAAGLVFYYIDGEELAGIGALKEPLNSYRNRVFKNARSPDRAADFFFELGWLYVIEKYRGQGLSRKVAEAALNLAAGRGVFATTRVDNCPMCRTNKRLGFELSGEPFRTTRSGRSYFISLFVHRGGETDLGVRKPTGKGAPQIPG